MACSPDGIQSVWKRTLSWAKAAAAPKSHTAAAIIRRAILTSGCLANRKYAMQTKGLQLQREGRLPARRAWGGPAAGNCPPVAHFAIEPVRGGASSWCAGRTRSGQRDLKAGDASPAYAKSQIAAKARSLTALLGH